MRVVGIDPAPRKGLTVYDGDDYHVPVSAAGDFLGELSAEEDVLICWDAPLTGPSEQTITDSRVGSPSAFTQRPVERFFSRKATGFRAPKGISVMPYAGCPHWALTRHLLGLPRVGPWDKSFEELPFQLARSDDERPEQGSWVVEVHPAVAAWLWCRQDWTTAGWRYKTDTAVRDELWAGLSDCVPGQLNDVTVPVDDDQLDARVAYILGRLWLLGGGEVILLGDLDRGTLLLPAVEGLEEAFDTFTNPHR